MVKYIKLIQISLLFVAASVLHAKTLITSQADAQKLLGSHPFSLQWVSWEKFGTAVVTDKKGTLYIYGEQRIQAEMPDTETDLDDDGSGLSVTYADEEDEPDSPPQDEYVTMDGMITEVGENEFTFQGKIVTRVDINNGGQECVRDGVMTFAITQNRHYWRLQQMVSPCDDVTDYVDIFFTPPEYPLTVNTNVANARIRVMNITPVYAPGMMLAEGQYHLEISSPGYKTRNLWVNLTKDQTVFDIQLDQD